MNLEIERKFLVRDTAFLVGLAGEWLVQGYVARAAGATVRVRVAPGRAWLTLKERTPGIARAEFEYPIPVEDAEAMLATLCEYGPLAKRRYRVPYGRHVWDVDVFAGDNAGLVLAEVELGASDEEFARPPWLGPEVSGDPRYCNSRLAEHPFTRW